MFAKGQEFLCNLSSEPASGPMWWCEGALQMVFFKVLMIFCAVAMVGSPFQIHRGVLFRDISTLPLTLFLETLFFFF